MFGFSNCRLSLRFLDKFLLHMMLPLVLLGTLAFVRIAARFCKPKGGKGVLESWNGITSKLAITTILLLYPGVCGKNNVIVDVAPLISYSQLCVFSTVRVFQVFKCTSIYGGDFGDNRGGNTLLLSVLQQDYRVRCYSPDHQKYIIVAAFALVIFVIGVPATVFCILRFNRRHLYDEDSPKHAAFKKSFGSLYTQYEPQYFEWEIAIMLKKMFLTGALVVIAPGSSPQLLVGLFIAVGYQLVTLKCAPFVEDPDDWLSFVTSSSLVVTLLFGLVLALDKGGKRDYDTESVGQFLIALHVGQFLFFAVSIALLCPCIRRKLRHRAHEAGRKLGDQKTQVVPYHKSHATAVDAETTAAKTAFIPGSLDAMEINDLDTDYESGSSASEDEETDLKNIKGSLTGEVKKPGIFGKAVLASLDA